MQLDQPTKERHKKVKKVYTRKDIDRKNVLGLLDSVRSGGLGESWEEDEAGTHRYHTPV